MKKILLVLFAASCLFLFSTAAICGEGVYVGAGVGVAMLSDSDVTDTDAPGTKLEFEHDMGLATYLALGYDLKNNVRLEGEISYQVNDYDETVVSGSSVDLSGDVYCLAFLVNAYYDFENDSAFTPFVTAGAGIAKVETAEFSVAGSGVATASDDDTVFAYQVGVGLTYDISNMTAIDCKYRFFATDEPSFDTVDSEFVSHNIYLGVRLSF